MTPNKSSGALLWGTVKPDGTLELDEPVQVIPGRVRVIVEHVPPPDQPRPMLVEVLEQIRRDQEARGYKPPTPEEMEALIAELREDEEYEERWRQIWAQTEQTPPKGPLA